MKIPALSYLEQYSHDENIHVTFTSIDMVSSNPDQSSASNTPYGIYAYPLNDIYPQMVKGKSASSVPTAGHKPYIFILRQTSTNFINHPDDYTEMMFKSDLKSMKSLYEKYDCGYDYDYMGAEMSKSSMKPFYKLLNMTKTASRDIQHNNSKDSTLLWNVALRHLGYDGLCDRGMGAIHPQEPIQTLFLVKNAFTVIDKVLNTEYNGTKNEVSATLSPCSAQSINKKHRDLYTKHNREQRFKNKKKG